MSTYQHDCNSDYRNESWSFAGSGVDALWKAWSSHGDDTKYCKNPATKGRGTVRFPVDIGSGSIPDGSVIESITLWARANKTDSSDRTFTVNLLCSDDTSKFTQRTIHPTTTITDIEVGTFTVDCLGQPWTKDRLNRIMIQAFSYCGIADKVRVYTYWVVVNYRVRPTLFVTAPTGTVTTPAPVVAWTYTQADGDPQKSAQYKIFTADQQEVAGFSPDTSASVYSGSVTGDVTSFTLPTALAANDYYIYVRATSTRNAKSLWTDRTFTVQGGAPGVPGGTFGGVGAGGGGGFESVIADRLTSSAYLSLRDGSNLLGVQAADFETVTDGITYTTTNCSAVQDTTTFYNIGGGSLKLTAASAATMSVTSTFHDVAASTPITLRVQFIAAVTTRTVNTRILFFDATFASISGTISGTGTDPSTTWTEVLSTGTTPAGAAYAQVQIEVVSPANAEVHNVDGIGLMYGTNSVWSNGGHASRNLLSAVASNAEDAPTAQSEPWAATSAATTYTRVASTGTGADSNKQFKLTYVGISPSLSFVSTSTAFSDTTTGTGYTLNKPASVADNDLLIAYVASDTGGTVTAPTGWLVQNTIVNSNSSLNILTRDALAADPSTWTGNFASSKTRARAVVVAYRGAAPSASQFLVDNVNGNTSGNKNPTSATINNTDANAWRLSAFATNDDVAGGASIANIVAPNPAPISFVGAATQWTSIASTTSFTVNKPAGIATGDLMLAAICCEGSVTTVTPPSGWTLVRKVVQTNGTAPSTFAILKRTAGASEPTSWTGTFSSSVIGIVTQNSAYRNCKDASLQFVAENTSSSGSGQSITTASVVNTNSGAWRVCAFGATDPADRGGSQSPQWSTTEVNLRSSNWAYYNTGNGSTDYAITAAMADSNGKVGTGTYSRAGTLDVSYYAANSWIGLLVPLDVGGTPGANETERADASTGAANPYLYLGVYDSGGPAATGSQSVTLQFTPGSGTSVTSTADWIGILSPAAPTIAGEASATLVNYVDISNVSTEVIQRSGGRMAVMASFLGSTAGTPYLIVYFYSGNELISTQLAQGTSFNTTVWTKSYATFAIPTGTTRVKLGVKVSDRTVNDIVYFDRVSVGFGTGTVYRSGTGLTAHPVFNIPLLEYAEDRGSGYGDWAPLPATERALLKYDQLTGLTTFVDQTLTPLANRKYRARTQSFGLAGDTFMSNYGPESDEVNLIAAEWWLKDVQNPDNSMQLKVRADPLSVNTSDTSAVFQPLGSDRPMVLTEGLKGDVITLTLQVRGTEYTQLRDLLGSRKTLYLQSNIDNAWWVRPVGDIQAETQLAGYGAAGTITNPLRFVKVQFVEVNVEA